MPVPDPAEPIALVLYEDPLSPWCALAERRIAEAAADLGVRVELRHAPYPLRAEPRLPSRRERRRLARAAQRASQAPGGHGLRPDLWLSDDPPLSSIPPLAALAAARRQGRAHEAALRLALREAALVRGLNVARLDVLYELAERCGLDLERFAGAVAAPATERAVLAVWRTARGRGIDSAPALVIGEEWLVVGARRTEMYRSILRRFVSERLGMAPARTFH